MNYSQIMSPVPLCLEKWGVMTPPPAPMGAPPLKRCILAYSYYGTLIGNPTPGIQRYNFRPPGVTPNRGMNPP